MAIKQKLSLIDRLKTVRADLCKLLVYTADADEPMEAAVPNVRNRWSRVQEVLDEVQWTKVEALDKKNAVLLVHNRGTADERPANELEDLATGAGESGRVSSLLQVAVHWVLRAQDGALSRQAEAMSTVMDAQNRLVESTMRRFEQMDRQYNEMLRVNHAMHGERFAEVERMLRHAREQMSDTDGATSDKLLEAMLPAMMKAAMDKTGPEKADTKPNGAPTKKAST
jgi:hypothetical protein